MTGVPAAGLPNTTSTVSRSARPACRASAAWSMTANTRRPFARAIPLNRATVSATVRGLALLITPSPRPAAASLIVVPLALPVGAWMHCEGNVTDNATRAGDPVRVIPPPAPSARSAGTGGTGAPPRVGGGRAGVARSVPADDPRRVDADERAAVRAGGHLLGPAADLKEARPPGARPDRGVDHEGDLRGR